MVVLVKKVAVWRALDVAVNHGSLCCPTSQQHQTKSVPLGVLRGGHFAWLGLIGSHPEHVERASQFVLPGFLLNCYLDKL